MNALRKQIRSLLRVEPRESGFRAMFDVSSSLSILPDHFPQFPLLPGICMMQAVLQAAAVRQGVDDLILRTVKNAKMMQPVLPGEQIVIDGEITLGGNDDIMIKAKLSSGEKRCAEFALLARVIPKSESSSLSPSHGTPGEGRGEGNQIGDGLSSLKRTLSRITGRGKTSIGATP